MLKQITNFSREIERHTCVIDIFVMVDDPQQYAETIRSLAKDGARLLSADGDTIRARYHGCGQDKLIELLNDGWSFAGQVEE